MGSVRRRQLMGGAAGPDEVAGYTIPGNVKKGTTIEVEHPDCFRFDWYQSAVGDVELGYFFSMDCDYTILDGVKANVVSGSKNFGVLFSNVSIGYHTAYIHTKKASSGSHLISNYNNALYVRLPQNANVHQVTITSGNLNRKWDVIDILCSEYVWQVRSNSASTFSNADVIRVPIGAKQQYIDAGTESTITDKMIEVNFKYTI